jgi:DNA polymerase-3 subunit delta'
MYLMSSFKDKDPLELYPWQENTWQRLSRQWPSLPHGLLFSGPTGLGIEEFARFLSKALLCSESKTTLQVCQHCRSCHLFEANTHPDFIDIFPEEVGKTIKIDALRDAISQVLQTGQMSQQRVILLRPAEAMNLATANAILKTLEEPPAGVYLILCTALLPRVLPTIASRCQHIPFFPCFDEKTLGWLEQQTSFKEEAKQALEDSRGCPLIAKERLLQAKGFTWQTLLSNLHELFCQQGSVLELTTQYLEIPVLNLLDELLFLVSQLIHALMLPEQPGLKISQDTQKTLTALARTTTLSALFGYYDYLIKQKKLPLQNLNQGLLIEDWLIRWTNLSKAL